MTETTRNKQVFPGGRGIKVFDWSPAICAYVAELWRRGHSASVIADEVGTTRNAVIGKLRRLGIERQQASPVVSRWPVAAPKPPKEPKPPREPRPKPAPKPKAKTEYVQPGGLIIARKSIARDPLPEDKSPPACARPWIERKFGQCAYPYGRGADTLSCCRAVDPGDQYCPEHRDAMGGRWKAMDAKTLTKYVKAFRARR